jgi:ADP-ribose pyrophosphatase YjhB (NUDIX family)
MTTIQIFDAQGQSQTVSSKTLTFRPAIYGIFIEHDQILLLRDQETQLLRPPGRIVAENEAPSQAIRHYLRELASITPQLGPLLFIENQYRQENGRFWQLSVLYYGLKRPSTASILFTPPPEAPLQPEWLPLNNLGLTQFEFGYEAIQAGKLHHQLTSPSSNLP